MRGARVALSLSFAGAGPRVMALAEPTGHDELSVDGVDTQAALNLLDRLIDSREGNAAALCASDRDSLFVALYQNLWGDQVSATAHCVACAEKFDLSFRLSELRAHLWAQTPATAAPPVPYGADELAAAALGAAQGARHLAVQLGLDLDDLDAACEILQDHYPIFDLELDSPCPECGHIQQAHFDLQSFLLLRLLEERPRLYAEIHTLASAYSWSLTDILGLPRSSRQALADRAQASQSALRWSLA